MTVGPLHHGDGQVALRREKAEQIRMRDAGALGDLSRRRGSDATGSHNRQGRLDNSLTAVLRRRKRPSGSGFHKSEYALTHTSCQPKI